MTGLYPPATGASGNHGRMNSDVITFADILRQTEGHYTGYVRFYYPVEQNNTIPYLQPWTNLSFSFFGKFHLDGEVKPGWGSEPDRRFGFVESKYKYNR